MPTIFQYYNYEQVEKKMELIVKLLKEGRHPNDIRKFTVDLGAWFDEFYSIAKARIKGTEKHPEAGKLYLNLEDLRFATPQVVADYRAGRLRCDRIVDLCAGAGFQSFSFAKQSEKVLAVELDERKAVYLKKNTQVLGLKNIEVMNGDVLSDNVFDAVKRFKPDIIFCDPERLPSETARTLESIKPSIRNLVDSYSEINENIAVELPPQLRAIRINGEFEKEYVALNGELNRLTVYFGELKKYDASAVALPEGYVIGCNEIKKKINLVKNNKYVYELNEAVVKAGLLSELLQKAGIGLSCLNDKIALGTSKELIKNPFFRNSFRLVGEAKDKKELISLLKKHGAKNIILRKQVRPEEYWLERKGIEKNLKGDKTMHVFFLKEKILVCEKISKHQRH